MHQREWKNDRTPWIFIYQSSWLYRAIPTDGVGQLFNKKIKSNSEGTLKGGKKKGSFLEKRNPVACLGDLPMSCAEVAQLTMEILFQYII